MTDNAAFSTHCGHDPAQFVIADEGTSYCPACESDATAAASLGIGREKLSRRARLKWWLIFHVRWVMRRGSRDGRVRYVR